MVVMTSNKTIFAIGDSHARPFTYDSTLNDVLAYELDVHAIGIGMASARGLLREQNTTNSRKKIQRAFRKFGKPIDAMVFNFGQVDVEYVFPYRQYVKGVDEEYINFVKDTVDLYLNGVASFSNLAQRIIVKGINYPVIYSRKFASENTIQQLRIENQSSLGKDEKSQLVRTIRRNFPHYPQRRKRALLFNKHLKAECAKRGYGYFDILDQIINPTTRRLKFELLPYAKLEHHLANNVATQKLYLDGLNAALSSQ